jgi:hypothetical protein
MRAASRIEPVIMDLSLAGGPSTAVSNIGSVGRLDEALSGARIVTIIVEVHRS